MFSEQMRKARQRLVLFERALIFAKYQDGEWAVLNLEGRHLHFPPLDKYYGVTQLGFAGVNGGFADNHSTDFSVAPLASLVFGLNFE